MKDIDKRIDLLPRPHIPAEDLMLAAINRQSGIRRGTRHFVILYTLKPGLLNLPPFCTAGMKSRKNRYLVFRAIP